MGFLPFTLLAQRACTTKWFARVERFCHAGGDFTVQPLDMLLMLQVRGV